MAALAMSRPLARADRVVLPVPELLDADYISTVLQLVGGKSENQIEQDLEARASALGIETPKLDDEEKRNTSSAQSASTVDSFRERTFSTASGASASTALTSDSSLFVARGAGLRPHEPGARQIVKDLSFSQYERYLSQIGPKLDQPKNRKAAIPPEISTAKSLFSVKTKRSFFSVKSGLKEKLRWRRKSFHPFDAPVSCVCCREDYKTSLSLQTLPCGHTYCANCIKLLATQATTDESKMPPRCCTQPVPGPMVRTVLDRDAQQAFLKAVVQFSTPWESRIFCPKSACGEFIPPRHKVDPRHPFDVTCRSCGTSVCVLCKHDAHPVGRDCPNDWELEAVLKMGEKSGWRRCYKCKNLVELAQGCTHMTCRCKAQFCYICGGVWDPDVGCPNICNGEEELERRRLEEEERVAKLSAEKAAEEAAAALESAKRAEAEARSRNQPDFKLLGQTQDDELQRFQDYSTTTRELCRWRHRAEKVALEEKHADQESKMRERHAKTVGHLDDRQIAAEMELRASLEQSERSVRIRLKHMEAYCDGLGRAASSKMPPRVVTERDLRELGQQYNIRDDMSRLHQAKINVMRDRQAKQMEDLVQRQETELQALGERRQEDLEDLAARFAHEEDTVNATFKVRQARLQRRWDIAIEILRKELTSKDGIAYGRIATPKWPEASADANTAVKS